MNSKKFQLVATCPGKTVDQAKCGLCSWASLTARKARQKVAQVTTAQRAHSTAGWPDCCAQQRCGRCCWPANFLLLCSCCWLGAGPAAKTMQGIRVDDAQLTMGFGNLSTLPSESQVRSARVASTLGSSSRRWMGISGNTWSIAQLSMALRKTAQQAEWAKQAGHVRARAGRGGQGRAGRS